MGEAVQWEKQSKSSMLTSSTFTAQECVYVCVCVSMHAVRYLYVAFLDLSKGQTIPSLISPIVQEPMKPAQRAHSAQFQSSAIVRGSTLH